jgi:periplasmic divalent cation tolerance protein
MDEVLLVLCTFPDSSVARQIGTALIERQHAACVNLIPGVDSIYRWQGEVETATETLAIIKTTRAVLPEITRLITELHPYQVPEIVAISPSEINAPYLRWLQQQVGASGSQD